MQKASPTTRFLVRASCLQIYQEQVHDLLNYSEEILQIREDKRRGVYADGLAEMVVSTPEEVYELMRIAGGRRATGSTRMNDTSSRSHAVFAIVVERSETIYVERPDDDDENDRPTAKQTFRVGKLNFVDLAGSERVRVSGASGQRLEETKKINASLSALGNVIAALAENNRKHVPYRDSKLTRLLEDSLGGNCKTTMLATVSPSRDAVFETSSTLKFATRAKAVRNAPKINEDLDQKSLLRKYERELKRLRAELDERSKIVVDQRRLLELDDQRRQAEEDKMVAIKALEARSLDFLREKEAKQALEFRIAQLTSHIGFLGGGDTSRETAIDVDVTAPEKEETTERYKQLLLKQRDIMIALTQRLNERDEQIGALQDELDSYDKSQAALENKLDEKTAQCIQLQRIQLEHDTKAAAEIAELHAVLDLRDKERRAVQTIFEKKILLLIDGIEKESGSQHVTALRRLVQASVDALRQADAESQHRSIHPIPPPPPVASSSKHSSVSFPSSRGIVDS